MPRAREDQPDTTTCPRCQGDGTIGRDAAGNDIACPACNAAGRTTRDQRAAYERNTAERHDHYVDRAVDFVPAAPHHELATISTDKLLVRPGTHVADADTVTPGRVLVAPIRTPTGVQFVVVGGQAALDRALAARPAQVQVEVITNSQVRRAASDAVPLTDLPR